MKKQPRKLLIWAGHRICKSRYKFEKSYVLCASHMWLIQPTIIFMLLQTMQKL